MSGKRAKQIRKYCRKLWDEDETFKIFYGENNFRKFHREFKHNYVRKIGLKGV